MAASSDPITNVFLLTAKEHLRPSQCLRICLTCTQRGHEADLYESSWRSKGKRILCYDKDPNSSYIITDVLVIKDDEEVPNGYSGIFLTDDTKEKGLRKHILCVKKEQRQAAGKGVTELVLINQNKGERADPTFYTISHEINEMNLTFRVELLGQTPPNVLPRPNSTIRVNEVPLHMPRTGSTHSMGQTAQPEQPKTAAPISPVTGIEGVPFAMNPKFDMSVVMNDPFLSSIPFITVEDINRKYQYDFNMENEAVRKS